MWDISKTPHGGAAPMVLRHRTDYHVNCVRFSPFEEDHLVTCGKNSIRAYRLRKGQLRGCSVSLGDLKLSKMMSGEAAAATDKTQKKKRPVDERLLNDFTTLAFEIGYGVTDLDALRASKPQPVRGEGFELHRIGDAAASRNIPAAILDAFRLLRVA